MRLFPNHEGIHYQGRVHELLEHSIRAMGRHRVMTSEVRIHHWGHTAGVKARKQKGELYTPLGQSKIEEMPSDWKSHFELGVEHNNNGKLVESEQAFLKALELNPTYLSAWVNLGYVQTELKKYAAAQATLSQALKIDSRSEEAYCNLGVSFLRMGQFQRAEAAFRQAISCDSKYVNAYSNLGITLAKMGRLSESALIFHRIKELLPMSIEADTKIAALYDAAGLSEIARRYQT